MTAGPSPVRSCLDFGNGRRPPPEQLYRDGWQHLDVFAVRIDDPRLTWPERELVRQLGEKLYGKRGER